MDGELIPDVSPGAHSCRDANAAHPVEDPNSQRVTHGNCALSPHPAGPIVIPVTVIEETIHQMGKQARAAAYKLAQLTADEKNAVLRSMAAAVRKATPELLDANARDLAAGTEKGLSAAMLDRLKLDETRIEAMAAGVDQVATLPDPVGQVMENWTRPMASRSSRSACPSASSASFTKAAPTSPRDAAVLCFKTGNATILRGGSEALHSNVAIATALASAGAPDHAIQLIPFTDRESVARPRRHGPVARPHHPARRQGADRNRRLARPHARHQTLRRHLPRLRRHGRDLAMAVRSNINAKTQKPGVCNALETLLVHRDVAKRLPTQSRRRPAREKSVELRGCSGNPRALTDISPPPRRTEHAEYLDLILSVKIVGSLDEAIAHIKHYGSRHTDVIVTGDHATAERFLARRRFRLLSSECQHPLHRRRRVRLRRGDRHQHRQTPRPRPDGSEGTHQLQIPG